MLKLGEHLLDGIEIGAFGRQEEKVGAGIAYRPSDGLASMAAQIAEDDDVAGVECRDEALDHPSVECRAVDGPVEHERSIDPVVAQGGKERHGAPAGVGCPADQAMSAGAPASPRAMLVSAQVSVDEDEACGIDPPLTATPPFALAADARPVLFAGECYF